MISRTKLKQRIARKTHPATAATIAAALKARAVVWKAVAQRISGATRKHAAVNLDAVDSVAKTGDTVIVVGKVLSSGDVTKKVRICALGFSAAAREKLRRTKSEAASILEEIQKNPRGEGVKVL